MTEIQIEKSLEERRKEVENDLSSLSRVSHRLAMLDTTEKLSQVLDKLLPRLLNRIGENHQRQLVESSLNEPLSRTHSKLVEMLSHTMKRVREDKRCQLPCRGILDLLVEESSTGSLVPKGNVDTFTLNLSLAFLTLGINRCPEWEELVPGLLVLHGFFSSLSPDKLLLAPSTKSQWHQVTHLLFRTMDNIMKVEDESMKNQPSSFFNASAGKRLKPSATTDPTEAQTYVDDPLTNIRALLAKDETAACACYDLLLDLILYQTVPANSSVPPPGLSQAAHLRLSGGASESARDWGAEMAPRNQLVQMKSRILDWIAPSRRWGLFMMSSSGKIRSLALLMSAAGDPTPEVSQKASMYLKQVLDAQRDDTDVYGDPILLIQELLILCVGASNAQLVLSKQSGDSNLPTLGISREVSSECVSPQTVLSLKRRMVADSTFATLIDYAAKVLVDVPQSFDDDSFSNSRLSGFGSLAILACNKTLSQLRSSSGLTMLRAKSYIAAAQLLNALVVRLSTMKTPHESRTALLSKTMGIACDCLSTIVASKSSLPSPSANNNSGSEGNTAVRDALYGTICILSRSALSPEKMSWLFAKGNLSLSSLSAETATLLFGCIAAEEEVLRPRAVAALDALLAAYCRLISSNKHEVIMTNNRETLELSSQVVENPWGQMPTSQVETQAPENNMLGYIQKSELSKLLLPLLWTAAQHSQPNQSRVAAARWASDLLSLLDLTSACHILCFLAGDSDVTASTLARNALAAVKVSKNEENLPAKPIGDFSEMIGVIFTDTSTPTANSWRPSFWEFTPKRKTATVEYLLQCLLHDIYGGDDEAMRVFVLAVSTSILEASSQARREFLGLLDECAGALSLCLFTSPFARSIISSGNVPLSPRKIQELSLQCTSSKARRLLAESWGHLYSDTLLYENDVWAETIEMAMQSCCEIIEGNSSTGEKHGAGFLGGTCIKLYRQQTTLHNPRSMANLASKILGLMGKELMNTDDLVANAFADGIAVACSYSQDDAPILEAALVPGAAVALTKLAEAIRKYGNGESIDIPRISKLARSAGMCLAVTTATTSSDSDLGDSRLSCVDSLFLLLGSAAFRKDEEVALWAGEALAEYCDAYSPINVTWSTAKSDWPQEESDEFARGLPPHQQVIYKLLRRARLEGNPQKRSASAPALFAVVARAAKRINVDPAASHRSMIQELCFRLEEVQGCFLKLLADPKSRHLSRESCCLGLAACRRLASISCSQYQSDDMNTRLLRAFGQTTVHGGSAMQETPEQAAERRRAEGNTELDTVEDVDMPNAEVGGASGIAEASLGAYREMAGAAVSLGRPDILYALLMLSVSNPAWSAEGRDYGSSALLGQQAFLGSHSNAVDTRLALKSHLGKLIPRILRGCHSPNKEAWEQMQNLWNGLTGGGNEARSVITEHLKLTVDTLVEDSTSKLWRTRFGACSALAQVLVGRSWRELGGGPALLFDDDIFIKSSTESTTGGVRLLRIWRVAMRALDDVRENVREAGQTLGRGVRSLTLGLVDPHGPRGDGYSSPDDTMMYEKDASAAAATALRWLIKHGLKQQCAEAAGVCISCLIGIVDVANPTILQPLVPDLLRSLLLSMSSLEPAAFNYLSVRAAGQERGSESYDALERLRIQVVQSGPMATAVTRILDMVPHMDVSIQKAVVPELDSAIRLSAGLTTRTAAADCVSTLCSTCPEAFRSNGLSSTNPSVSLLRALYWASERERGQAARDKYAHACGNLAALCPGSSVRSLALKVSQKYNRSTGSNDDPSARKAAASTLRAIAVRASNQFGDGGTSDLWCRRVLPIAFLGIRDPEPNIATLFADVWEEGGSAVLLAGAADGFGSTLEEKLIMYLVDECIKALVDVSWSRRVSGANALRELAVKEILSPPPRRLVGAPKDGNLEESLRGQRRVHASHRALVALTKAIADTRLWTGKQNVVDACCLIASKWSSALANAGDLNEVPGKGLDTTMFAPLALNDHADTDSLFAHDGRFKKQTDEELPDEATQSAEVAMEIDEEESLGETKLDFDNDVVGPDEKTESCVFESSSEDKRTGETLEPVPTFIGICRMFLVQAFPTKRNILSVKEEEVLPYRAASLKALADLLDSIDKSTHGCKQKAIAFTFVTTKLAPLFDNSHVASDNAKEESPLVVSRALDCFGACFWEGIGSAGGSESNKYTNVLVLVQIFERLSAVELPWTVKMSALNACARLIVKADATSLEDHSTVSAVVNCASQALKDRKFWKVRHAGLHVLDTLVARCGQAQSDTYKPSDRKSKERQLILEAVLPQKESILQLAKPMLRDSEANVTALASQIAVKVAWWP